MTALSTRRLRIERAGDADFTEVAGFLEANPAQYLPLPALDSLSAALSHGDVFVARLEGETVACAGLFEMCEGASAADAPRSSDIVVLELAAARVLPVVGGLEPFTLQDLFVSMRLVGAMLSNGERGGNRQGVSFLASVLDGNAKSSATMARAGFRALPDVPRWLAFENRTWATSVPTVHWQAEPGCTAVHARRVHEAVSGTASVLARRNRSTGEREAFGLVLDDFWMADHSEALMALGSPSECPIVDLPRIRRVGDASF